MLEWIVLLAIGFAVGSYAGSVGAGGGFLLAPVLLLRYPEAAPEEITTATLTAVAISNGVAAIYAWRIGRMDRPLAGLLVIAALPAALLGAAGTALLPREVFAFGFGLLLAGTGSYLVSRSGAHAADLLQSGWRRELADPRGGVFDFRVPVWRSISVTSLVAGVSTLAGIGGGLLYAPLTTRVMRIPRTLAVPISQVLITGVATSGAALHLVARHAGEPMHDIPWLAAGVILSVPVARRLHDRLGEGLLERALAAGLILVGVRTALLAF